MKCLQKTGNQIEYDFGPDEDLVSIESLPVVTARRTQKDTHLSVEPEKREP